MPYQRIPLRAGGPAGRRIVLWLTSNNAALQAQAAVSASGYQISVLNGEGASGTATATSALIASAWRPSQPPVLRTYYRYSRDDYHQMLCDLLPRGLAWPRDGEDGQLMYAWSAELFRVEQRGWQLLNEWDPRTTQELFTDWEQFFVLDGKGSDDIRRQKLIAEWLEGGTLSQSDMEDLLATIGVDATVYYPKEFRCGMSTCGQALATGWHSTIVIYVHNPDEVDLDWLQTYLEHIASGGDYILIIPDPIP